MIKKILLFLLIWLIFVSTGRRLSAEETNSVKQKYVALTSFTIIAALLLILVQPKQSRSSGRGLDSGFGSRCPVCDNTVLTFGRHCNECGAKI
ncbi:MAG: hypothetical protein Q7T18_11280 [Sedimentisphaerales bacterium]|nr:hypothetical protein [Sedimentisphaerales bacterium]